MIRYYHRPWPRYPRHTIEKILAWADAHYARTGDWPSAASGFVTDAPDEKWSAINGALLDGHRGLPGGDSLARLLARERGRHHRLQQALFSEEKILEWAD